MRDGGSGNVNGVLATSQSMVTVNMGMIAAYKVEGGNEGSEQ